MEVAKYLGFVRRKYLFTADHTRKSFILWPRISEAGDANDTRGTEERNMGTLTPAGNILSHQNRFAAPNSGGQVAGGQVMSSPRVFASQVTWQVSLSWQCLTWVMGSFITSTSVTVPNWPKYSRSRSWFVCQLRPPTNSFPGAESELGVLRPLDSPCKIMETLECVLFLDFVFLSLSKVVSCSPNHFLQLVKFEPQELPVSTQLKLKSFQFFGKESWIIFLYYSTFVSRKTIFWSWYFLTCLGSDIIWGERELRQPGELVHREPEMIKWYQLTIVKVLSSKISKFLSHFISWRSHIVSQLWEGVRG